MSQVAEQAQQLLQFFSSLKDGCIVAYSGGVDSALLAVVAKRALGDKALAVLAQSPSLSLREKNLALEFAKQQGFRVEVVNPQEMHNPAYRANEGDRCYYCKKALFEKLEELNLQRFNQQNKALVYGVNVDDLGDYRPGMKAAKEAKALYPYVDLNINKASVRALAEYFKLSLAQKPASPCLASRIPHGEEVNEEKLKQIEQGEDLLHALGFRVFRLRHHGHLARLEVAQDELEWAFNQRKTLTTEIKKLGFNFVTLDLAPFKSGSLNITLSLDKQN